MKKVFLLLIILTLAINFVYALDCQYTEEKMSSEPTNVFYHGTLKLNYSVLEAKEFVEGYTRLYCYYPQFKVYNNMLSQEINVTVSYIFNGQRQEKDVSIAPEGYSNIQIDACGQSGLDTQSVQYKINSPTFLEAKREIIPIIDCLKCPKDSETICLNDGMPCESNLQCGSNFCIRGICSGSEVCYNNDCKCPSNQIQCDDNQRCVEKNSVPLDVKPLCNKAIECITGYIDLDKGLCAKSPTQLQEEENRILKEEQVQKEERQKFIVYSIITFAIIFLIGISLRYHFKKKSIKDLKKEIEGLTTKVEEGGKKLQDLNTKIKNASEEEAKKFKESYRQQKKEQERQMSDLIRKENELEERENKWQKQNKEFLTKEAKDKYELRYHNQLKLDDKGYFRFKDSNILLHRYIYEDNIGQIKRGDVIHHIDCNKLNNEPWNLIAIPESEHKAILKHSRIPFGDWEKGIKELKDQLGMKEGDFHKYIKEHLTEVDNKD